ncbi:MAG: hypothetical protein ACI4PE_04120 [Bacilli bacterium]
MKKRRKLKKKVLVLIILVIVLILGITGIILYKTLSSKTDNSAKVVDEIPEYGYTLEADQPKIYKELFKELSEVLSKEKVDEEKYAELIARMSAIDFYNLENKVSKNDVGATQFIREKNVDNFVLEASETVYKYIEQNIYGDRNQTLPEVVSSKLKSIKQEAYNYKNIKDDKAYTVIVNLEYKKDLDYPTEVTIKLLHSGKKLEIYEMN